MAQYEMNLRDYWLIVRRRRAIIIASTVLVALLSLGFASQKVPVYQATAAVKFEQSTRRAETPATRATRRRSPPPPPSRTATTPRRGVTRG